MALITCPGCSKQISDSAESCPKCGYGIGTASKDKAADVPHAIVQRTSRKLAIQRVISVLLFIAGVIWIFVLASSADSVDKSDLMAPVLMAVAGLVWAIVTKIRTL